MIAAVHALLLNIVIPKVKPTAIGICTKKVIVVVVFSLQNQRKLYNEASSFNCITFDTLSFSNILVLYVPTVDG